MAEKKYSDDGSLIVSEFDMCAFFEVREYAAGLCSCKDCFFCRFSDFRKMEYIEKINYEERKGVLYSVCHNEKNRKDAL